jgi:hypothetical protein
VLRAAEAQDLLSSVFLTAEDDIYNFPNIHVAGNACTPRRGNITMALEIVNGFRTELSLDQMVRHVHLSVYFFSNSHQFIESFELIYIRWINNKLLRCAPGAVQGQYKGREG